MFDNFELLPNPSNFNVFKVRVRKTIHRRPHNVELVDYDLGLVVCVFLGVS